MNNVRDLIRRKGSQVFSIRPNDFVFDAMKMMAENNTGALLVMEADEVAGLSLSAIVSAEWILKENCRRIPEFMRS